MPHARRQPTSEPFPDPVSRLLTLGAPGGNPDASWRNEPFLDYSALGITRDHIPALLRLARDRSALTEGDLSCYGPVHALRALGTFADPDCVRPIIELVDRMDRDDDEFWLEDAPGVLARFGSAAITPLALAYRDARRGFGARLFLGNALEKIAGQSADARTRIVAIFTDVLRYARFTDPNINGDAVAALVELGAAEALPVIRQAFDAGFVDQSACGKLADVEVEIVLSPEALEARRTFKTEKMLERFAALGLEHAIRPKPPDAAPPEIIVPARSDHQPVLDRP